ncbi:MAG: hypothetical protein C4K60_12385 [Ideonella sp. MAG2]|nr:MAG: hypothetical protein C4K60_12385 [Ideonella sp. MAG2]
MFFYVVLGLTIVLAPARRIWAVSVLSPAVLAGDGFYSTYLFHGSVMGLATRQVAASNLAMGVMPFAFAAVVVCSMGGVLIYRHFERPVTSRLNRRWTMGQGWA